jgi:transposase
MSATVLPLVAYCFSKTEPKPELRCSGCGTTQEAACDCGVAYAPVARASERAMQAVLANKEKSNRAIAQETGLGIGTINRARRKATEPNGSVETREGLDGKIRKLPKPKPQGAIVDFKKRKRTEAKAVKEKEEADRKAFLLRADASREYAELEPGKADTEMLQYAEAAFAAWGARVETMKQEVATVAVEDDGGAAARQKDAAERTLPERQRAFLGRKPVARRNCEDDANRAAYLADRAALEAAGLWEVEQ